MSKTKKMGIFTLSILCVLLASGCSRELLKSRVVNSPEKEDSDAKKNSETENIPRDEFEEVELFYALGVAANQEGRWLQAQDHFEEALELLASLDIEEGDSPRELKFERLLNEIAEDYKTTLLGLGVLSSESSISAFLQRFEDIENFKMLQRGIELEEPEIQSEEVTYDMPIEWNQRVENSIIYFQTVAREAFKTYMKRSGKYKDLMQRILKEKGLPEDLVWLCLVESGFNPKAYSWARAMGPWQFIAATGRRYGLRANWWYDERRDFVKSTYAACDYLSALYNAFGSWPLALAAYNWGEGKVERAIKKHKTQNFWKLELNRETANHIPHYMAATIISKEPEKYGFELEYDDPIAYEVVKVNQPMDLKKVAKALGVSASALEELNPELRRGVTPPNYPQYQMRIPVGAKELFSQSFKGYDAKTSGLFVEHKVKKGQTLSHLSHRYGVPISAIMELNGLTNKHRLSIGQRLIIPTSSSKSITESSTKKSSVNKNKKSSNGFFNYTVKKGDNLSELAIRFGTSVSEIRRLNGLKSANRIYVGQSLRISGTTPISGGFFTEHVVQKGENLTYLANKYGVTVSAIQESNKMSSAHILRVGQRLLIPNSSQPTVETYVVKKGDTVSDLAFRFGSSPGEIGKLNGLKNTHYIKPGQRLKIPSKNGNGGTDGNGGRWITYIVRRGDSLWEIARAFGVLIEKIMQWNNISSPSRLQIGEKIKIFTTN